MRIHFAYAFFLALFLLLASKCSHALSNEYPFQDSCVVQAGDTFYRDCEVAQLEQFIAEAGGSDPKQGADWDSVEESLHMKLDYFYYTGGIIGPVKQGQWVPGMPVFSPQPKPGFTQRVSNPVPVPGTIALIVIGLALLWRIKR
jgi:hypothetical protein